MFRDWNLEIFIIALACVVLVELVERWLKRKGLFKERSPAIEMLRGRLLGLVVVVPLAVLYFWLTD